MPRKAKESSKGPAAKPRFTEAHKKYGHAHLYYLGGIFSLALFIFSTIQGVLLHTGQTDINDPLEALGGALLVYMIAATFFVMSIRCFQRGARHYKYF